jgi:protein arginine kinase
MNYIEFPKNQSRKKHPLDSLVFSTRVRIARNIEGLKFPIVLKEKEKKEASDKFCKYLRELPYSIIIENIENLEHAEIMTYLSNKVITHEFLRNGHCLAYETSGEWIILINEDDHFRISSIENGYNLKNMYNRLSSVVAQVEQNIDFSFDESFGYLTSSLINIGTGLRMSCLINLYGLVATKKIENFIDAGNKMGYSIMNLSESSDSGLFYIFNIYSLGTSEEEMIDEFEQFLQKTMVLENESREEYFGKRDELEISFEEIFEIGIRDKISWDHMLYYLSLLDALSKKYILIKDITQLRNLVYQATDDYLIYRQNVNPNSLETTRINLLKKFTSLIRYKKQPTINFSENL